MKSLRVALPVAAGLLLSTLPFLRYLHLGEGIAAHADHQPRHGGQLGMVGDHHIEVRRQNGSVEAFVSDAQRAPVRPRRTWVVFDAGEQRPLTWQAHRLRGPDVPTARDLEVVAVLRDGTRLATRFDFSEP